MPSTAASPTSDESSEAEGLPLASVQRDSKPSTASRSSGGLWFAALVAVVATAALVVWRTRSAAVQAETATDATPSVVNHVFALARLEPEGEVISVAPPSGAGSARVAVLRVEEGESVAKGDVLAVLDNDPRMRAAHAVAEAEVARARARLAQTGTDGASRTAELRALGKAAEARLETARIKLERERFLRRDDATSQDQVDDAELEYRRATEEVAEARARLLRYTAPEGQEPIDVVVARHDLDVAEATLRETTARLEEAYIRAPFDGVVLDITLREGEPVGQATLLEMGSTQRMLARAEVYESDVRRVALGQGVELTGPALDVALRGKVESIGTLVKKQSVVQALPAANTDARVVEVMIRLDEASSTLASRFVDMQVRAEFLP